MDDLLKTVVGVLKTTPECETINLDRLKVFPPFNNFIVSDEETVHIKIARPNTSKISTTGLGREYDLLKQNPTLTPLKPLHQLPLPAPYSVATVWEYANIHSFNQQTFTPQVVRKWATQLQNLNNTTYPGVGTNLFNHKERYEVILNRVTYAETHYPHLLDRDIVGVLMRIADKFFTTPKRLPAHRYVLNHGDAHYKNFMVVNGEPSLIDFESIGLAPKEWDIASVRSVLLREFNRPDLWAAFIDSYIFSGFIDFDLVDYFESVKTVSATSWLLLHPHRLGEFNNRVNELSVLLNSKGVLPSVYEHPIYHLTS